MGRDIPRWKMLNNKKYFYYQVFHTKTEADQWAKSMRRDNILARVFKHARPFIFSLSSDKEPMRYLL